LTLALKLFLGIDIGTSVTKGTLIREDGKVVAQEYSRAKYGSSSHTGSEHDPQKVWWDEFRKITTKLLEENSERRDKVESIAVTGMIPNITLIDKNGNHLGNSILFYDARAYDIEKKLDSDLKSPKWQNEVLSKLIWIKTNKPDVWNQTHKIVTTHSYIAFRLTGKYSVDVVTAIESGNIYDPTTRSWNSKLLEAYGIREDLFPEICAPNTIVGYLSEDAAKDIGLKQGIPVVAGTGDTISSLLGAGLRKKDEMLIYYGTYNCSALLKYAIRDVVSGNISSNPLEWTSTIPRSGQQLNAFAQQLFPSKSRQIALSKLDRSAEKSAPGANGVLFIQTFDLPISTVSTEPKGGLVNLSISNTIFDISRALLEAFGYGLKYSFEYLGSNPKPVKCFAAGGGARSPIWKQIVSDITGLEQTYLPAADRGMGSAILAGLAVRQDFLDHITDYLMKKSIVVSPNLDSKDRYQKMYELYCEYLKKYNQ
jgi:xylulokinase